MKSLFKKLPLAVVFVAASLAGSVTSMALAQGLPNGQIPIEDFVRQPKLRSVTFSPDGKLFAAVQEMDGRMALMVGDLTARKVNRITSFKSYDVRNYNWISNKRLIFSLYDSTRGLAEQRGGGVFAVNADGTEYKELSPAWEACQARQIPCRQIGFLQRIYGSEDEILATANERDSATEDVYRLNTLTGRKTLLTEDNPGKVGEWILDKDGVPRAAISSDNRTLSEIFWYRDAAGKPWRKISATEGVAKRIRPIAFDNDGSLFVSSNLNSDKFQIYLLDTTTGKLGELIADHPLVDLDTANDMLLPMVRLRDKKLVGFRVEADKPEVLWLDEELAKMHAVINGSLPKGNVNQMNTLDDGRVMVLSSSDRDPGAYYLYDPKAKQIQELLRPSDWIKPERMSSMQVVRYKARDGMEIPAYLTLPFGKDAKMLPLVAWIHGGPWARDHWGYQPNIQFLASRGYAVLQPNYRGSIGFGAKHLTSSFKQLGQSMQDDITDGVRHLVAQGIVDPKRVCIGGGSYGGYATMMGLVKDPDLYRCGIDEAGVVDLIWWQELGYTDFNAGGARAAEAWYDKTIGEVGADRAMMEKYSPRRHADQIKAAVMIVHGAGDRRVPIKHAEGMREALIAAGNPPEWVIYAEEGHGFTKPENNIDHYKKVEAFLAKHLGGYSVDSTPLKVVAPAVNGSADSSTNPR